MSKNEIGIATEYSVKDAELVQIMEEYRLKKLEERYHAGDTLSPIEQYELGPNWNENPRIIDGEYRVIDVNPSEPQQPAQE